MLETREEIKVLRAESDSREDKDCTHDRQSSKEATFKTQFEFLFRSDIITIYVGESTASARVKHRARLFSSEFSAKLHFSSLMWRVPSLRGQWQ